MTAWIIVITIAVVALIGISGALAGKIASLQEKHAEYAERYVMLEEWAEDWLKRLEQKVEAADMRTKLNAEQIKTMEDILPKDGNNEVLRHNALLQQMNDEMERSLRMEREWNDGLSSIMNYGKPNVEVNET